MTHEKQTKCAKFIETQNIFIQTEKKTLLNSSLCNIAV